MKQQTSTESARDRGAADSYYRRRRNPHVLAGGYLQVAVAEGSAEWLAYMEGYTENEVMRNYKDWGRDPDDERMNRFDHDYDRDDYSRIDYERPFR